MILCHRQPIVIDAIRTDGRALQEVFHPPERSNAAGRVFCVETDHVDGRVESPVLHGRLEGITLFAVPANHTNTFRHITRLPAIEASDLVPFHDQETDDARADVTCSANDKDFHGCCVWLREKCVEG